MEQSLRTFFEQDYPEFEIIFCVADPLDPTIRLVMGLMREYAHVPVRLHVGEAHAGPNPKVNNLIPGYEIARFDLALISDSNVRVWPTYLKALAACLDDQVGVVTAVVAGRDAKGLGGKLEAAYLNTSVARWMWIAHAIKHPCVIGKTMLFRRSTMNRFGGLRGLARYVAEDYTTGQAMNRLGLRTEVVSEPVAQFLGHYSFSTFWSRHLRWGRIRRSQSPPGFFMEPLQYALGAGGFGAFGFWWLFEVPALAFLAMHFLIWGIADASLMRRLEGKLTLPMIGAWFLRELLALPHWLHMCAGNKISWRGNRLRILHGGLVEA